jgi:hypothetical protein
MFDTPQVIILAKALQFDTYNSDPFEFDGMVNEELVDVLQSIKIEDNKITYIIDGKKKIVNKYKMVFHTYNDHMKINIGSHQVGRKNKKRMSYAFMYNGTDTEEFIRSLLAHIEKVDTVTELVIQTIVASCTKEISSDSKKEESRCAIM